MLSIAMEFYLKKLFFVLCFSNKRIGDAAIETKYIV